MAKISYSIKETNDFDRIKGNQRHKSYIVKSLSESFMPIYEPEGRWGKKTRDNGYDWWGVWDITENGLVWGHINRLNTNVGGLTHLKNKVNELMIEDGIDDPIYFNEEILNDEELTHQMLVKMFFYVKKYSVILFSDKHPFYHELIEILNDSWDKGSYLSNHFAENFKKYVPTAIGYENLDSKPGDGDDMFDGIDGYVIFQTPKEEKVKREVQIKGVPSVLLGRDNKFHVRVSMVLKKYKKVKLFVFYESNTSYIYLFKNDSNLIEEVIENNQTIFLFPQELLIKIGIK